MSCRGARSSSYLNRVSSISRAADEAKHEIAAALVEIVERCEAGERADRADPRRCKACLPAAPGDTADETGRLVVKPPSPSTRPADDDRLEVPGQRGAGAQVIGGLFRVAVASEEHGLPSVEVGSRSAGRRAFVTCHALEIQELVQGSRRVPASRKDRECRSAPPRRGAAIAGLEEARTPE